MTATTATAPQEASTASLRAWPVVVAALAASLALVSAEALLGPGAWYSWTLTAAVAVAAGAIGVNDAVSLKLPNRFTGAFAAAAAVQVIADAVLQHEWAVALSAVIAGAALFAVYVAFGFLGWAGFGDAKFAAGLGIAAAATAGLGALYVFPVAIVLAGAWRLLMLAVPRADRPRPHGPALAIAAVLVMVWAALAHSAF